MIFVGVMVLNIQKDGIFVGGVNEKYNILSKSNGKVIEENRLEWSQLNKQCNRNR